MRDFEEGMTGREKPISGSGETAGGTPRAG
jgi:hypothetical protein